MKYNSSDGYPLVCHKCGANDVEIRHSSCRLIGGNNIDVIFWMKCKCGVRSETHRLVFHKHELESIQIDEMIETMVAYRQAWVARTHKEQEENNKGVRLQ